MTFNGGVPVYVPLHPPAAELEKPTSNDWTIDFAELRYDLCADKLVVSDFEAPQGRHHAEYQDDHRQHAA